MPTNTPITCPQVRFKHPSETLGALFDLSEAIPSGDNLTGTPTITATPSGLTISDPAVTVASKVINGVTVAAGKAVSCTITGGTSGVTYTVTVSVNLAGGGNRVRNFTLKVAST